MKLNITQARDGIIIIDILYEIPVKVDKMDFELQDSDYRIVDFGNSTLAPTVKTDVTGFEFDEAGKNLKVFGANGQSVHSTSTNNKLVQVRVNFRTASITVYE